MYLSPLFGRRSLSYWYRSKARALAQAFKVFQLTYWCRQLSLLVGYNAEGVSLCCDVSLIQWKVIKDGSGLQIRVSHKYSMQWSFHGISKRRSSRPSAGNKAPIDVLLFPGHSFSILSSIIIVPISHMSYLLLCRNKLPTWRNWNSYKILTRQCREWNTESNAIASSPFFK